MPPEEKITFKEWIRNRKNWKAVLVPILVVAAVFVAGRLIDLNEYLETTQKWVWKLGPWGPVAFGAVYVGAMLLLLPGTPFTIVAALLFGSLWGYVTMLTATTAAAAAGFFIARYLAKEKVEKQLSRLEGFEKIKEWVEENHWLAIPVIRIMPMFPFSINNYALGLTDISFRVYLITSVIVFVPMTGVLVFGARALYAAMVRGEISWGLMAGTVGAGLVVSVLGIVGKRKFAPKLNRPGS